ALVDVRDVDLDGRHMRGEQRVAQGDTRVGEGAAIDHDALAAGVRQRGDSIDERSLVVRLEELELRHGAEFLPQRLLEIRQRGAAVDLRLPLAEPVEVRAVEDGDGFHSGLFKPEESCSAKLFRPEGALSLRASKKPRSYRNKCSNVD